MIKYLLIAFLFLSSDNLFAQITIDSSATEFSVKLKEGEVTRTLNFRRYKDSVKFTDLKYYVSPASKGNLSTETKYIKQLWDEAKDKIQINLKSVSIGNPTEYNDILLNQINAFNKSSKWQAHVKKNGKKLNYGLILEVMGKGNIYKPIDSLLAFYGYANIGYSNEKYGFLEKEQLIKLKFTGKEVVPIPYMVWIRVGRAKTK